MKIGQLFFTIPKPASTGFCVEPGRYWKARTCQYHLRERVGLEAEKDWSQFTAPYAAQSTTWNINNT